MSEEFKVYVNCITYNQSAYIKDTLNGFCMQQTDFPFVCCIIDDASTDGEQSEIQNYLEEHFDFERKNASKREETEDCIHSFAQHRENKNCYFAVVFLKYNHYSIRKDKTQYSSKWRNMAKYIALCEGDDYWIDPQKLYKQVSYMDNHPDCSLCYASARVFDQDSKDFSPILLGEPCESFEALLRKNVIPTLTVLYRADVLKDYYDVIKPLEHNWSLGDYPLWLWLAVHGTIHFLGDIVGVYRKINGSVSHPVSVNQYKKLINDANDIVILFDQKYNQGKLYKYREHLRYRGLMSIEANFNHSIRGVLSCFRKLPFKAFRDYLVLCKSILQIFLFSIVRH